MKQSVPPAVIAAVVVVAVVIIGYFIWKAMQPNPNVQNSSAGAQIQAAMKAKYPDMKMPGKTP